MNPELLLIETDRDLRNSADFLVIDKIAKAVFKVPGVGNVQAITRPSGEPLEFSTIPAQMSMGGTNQQMNQKYQEDMFANMLLQADDMQSDHRHDEPDGGAHARDERDHAQHGRQDR